MMSFEKAESSVPPSEGSNGHKDICVLVVDCDQTCLLTISRLLRAMTYQGVVSLFFFFCSVLLKH